MKYDPYKYLMPIQTINKLTFCLKAIKSFSAKNDPNLIGTIYVVASEILKEVAPEIQAIKDNAMKDENRILCDGRQCLPS